MMTTDATDTAGDGELLGTWLARSVEVALRVMAANSNCPFPGGIADEEWQDATFGDELWGRFPAVAADLRAMFALRSAADHALAASGCLTTRPFASLTLARAVIEASAVSVFLLDPEIEYAERCRRAVNEYLQALSREARMLAQDGRLADAAVNAAKTDHILAAADGFGWGQARPTQPPEYRRVAAIGTSRPKIMTLIDDLLSTDSTPGFGSQQYRAVSAIAHAAPHAIGLVGDGSEPLTARDIAQRHLPLLAAFGTAARTLCDRMGWDSRVLLIVYDKTLRPWLETAEPGSSAGFIDVF
jgi:hypothetical protein